MSQPHEFPDTQSFSRLVNQARAGAGYARSELCRHVQKYLCDQVDRELDQRLRAKVNPSDIAQQAMLRMVEGLADFRGASTQEFYAWLNTILRNELHSTRRAFFRQRRDVRREELPAMEAAQTAIANQNSVATELRQREQLEQFRQILGNLPEDYAQVVQLRAFDELPFAEIATRMQRSVDSVSKLWSRALVRLAEELKKKNESQS